MAVQSETITMVGVVEGETVRSRRRWARLRRDLVQIAIIAAVAALVVLFALAIRQGLARHGIGFSFDYLWNSAGINLSEGLTLVAPHDWPQVEAFTSAYTNAQALVAGFSNTLKIAFLAIILSTVIGTMIGVGRLSTNWIIRQLCFGIVEFVRNTPLLIQLVFWYFAVVLQFPPLAAAAKLYGGIIASQQGVFLPAIMASPNASLASVAAFIVALFLLAGSLFPGRSGVVRKGLAACGAVLLAASVALGFPLALDFPVANRFQASGGTSMSPEMAALLLAIVVNSAAYIAEIVRGAIETMPKGQWEAAAALGLSRRDTLKDIILPQVFRIVLPSFGNQYISLTKNTALGIAIGYPDLFNVYGTIANQTGRSLEGIIIVMVTYLLLSWVISAAVNLANRRLTRQGAGR